MDTLHAKEPYCTTAAVVAADKVLISLEADFAEDGKFGKRTLEVTSELVRVLEGNGAVSFQMPIAEMVRSIGVLELEEEMARVRQFYRKAGMTKE